MPTTYLESSGVKDVLGVVLLNSNTLQPTSGTVVLTSNVAAQIPPNAKSFQAVLTGTGSVSCNVSIQVSNDNVNYFEIYTISLAGTDTDSDIATLDYAFKYTKVVVSNLTGTGAACALSVSY